LVKSALDGLAVCRERGVNRVTHRISPAAIHTTAEQPLGVDLPSLSGFRHSNAGRDEAGV
jgi:hypothetical protein